MVEVPDKVQLDELVQRSGSKAWIVAKPFKQRRGWYPFLALRMAASKDMNDFAFERLVSPDGPRRVRSLKLSFVTFLR
jgi:hypothetical protein